MPRRPTSRRDICFRMLRWLSTGVVAGRERSLSAFKLLALSMHDRFDDVAAALRNGIGKRSSTAGFRPRRSTQ